MAPSVLGLGISADSPYVPDHLRKPLAAMLQGMDDDMNASPYDWDMFYVEADMEFGKLQDKLKEKEWDVVLVGMGLRTHADLTVFFEKIINAVHQQLPKTKFSFNTAIDKTREACDRVMSS